MRLTTPLLLLTAATTTTATATAQNPRGFPERLFSILDQDRDGRISQQELGPRRGRLFRRLDADGDGGVTLSEARAFYRGRRLPPWLARKLRPGLPDLAEVEGVRISRGGTWDNQPAVAVTADGAAWVAHVRHHHGEGDDVAVVAVRGGEAGEVEVVTRGLGQIVRPAICARGEELVCVWTRSEPERVASIWFARRRAGGWSAPRRLVPDERRAHQNPEIAAGPGGRVAVAYQVHDGHGYDVVVRELEGEGFGKAWVLGGPGSDDWDPVVAFDAGGRLHVVWCAFRRGDYDVLWQRRGDEAPRRLSARGEYDLHPWLTPAPDGSLWVSWDVVRITGHASSGRTTITGANLRRDADGGHGRSGARSWIEVRVLDGDRVRVPGAPRRQIVAQRGYRLAHCGFAKVALGPGGEPWVLYRVLRQDARVWLPKGGIGYYWHLLARPFRDGAWGEAVRLHDSDGYLEEPGVAAAPAGVVVAYGGERRAGSPARLRRAAPAARPREPHDHHHDFDGVPGCNGDVHVVTLAAGGVAAEVGALPAAGRPADRSVPGRERMPAYTVEHGGKTYRLLWGDTHRHSNVSRCSAGAEPTPDDLYRYGADICRYDFFALSDHAEHHRLTDRDRGYYYWWLQQKLADLYHVPGAMSVLYNFEWSLLYPDGHHNTIFPGRPTMLLARDLAATDSLAEGWEVLARAGARAITIPHTGADPRMGTAWRIQDDRFQRVCEIFQACRGSYEHAGCPREYRETSNAKGFYWKALEKGYHVGVIASSDHGYGVSYACVYATENSREAVWQALWDRRCYGATTYGLVLDLRSGRHWMGEVWKAREAPELEVFVRGAAPIRSVEILGRSQVLAAWGSVEEPLDQREVRLTWKDPDWERQTREQWYYVRVIQTDDEMAWSSPVWVTPARGN